MKTEIRAKDRIRTDRRRVNKQPAADIIRKVKAAEKAFHNGCGWASDLAQGISFFESAFGNTVTALEEIDDMAARRKIDERSEKRVLAALRKLRQYSSTMAVDDQPLTVTGIIEDFQQLYLIADEFHRLASELQALIRSRTKAVSKKERSKDGKQIEADRLKSSPGRDFYKKVKAADEAFQSGCGWAFNLAEGISFFETAFLDTVTALRDIELMANKLQLSERSVEQVLAGLHKLQHYSRMMAMDEPLTVVGIIEGAQGLYEIADELVNIAAEAKALVRSRSKTSRRTRKLEQEAILRQIN